MNPNPEQISPLSFRFLLEILLLSSALGLVLLVLHGPVLLFYLAPLLFVPLVIHRLRTTDTKQRERRSDSSIERRTTGSPGSK